MKKTINFNDFHSDFMAIRPDNFSYEGLRVLFDYLEEYEEETGEEIEFDVIALCCDFSEYTIEELANDYLGSVESETKEELKERKQEALDYVTERTTLLTVNNDTVIIQNF